MQPRRAGKNLTQAVQNSFERGLVGKAGRIQQSSISIFGVSHDPSAVLAISKCRGESSTATTERPYRDAGCTRCGWGELRMTRDEAVPGVAPVRARRAP
jgi:hypothetical protein